MSVIIVIPDGTDWFKAMLAIPSNIPALRKGQGRGLIFGSVLKSEKTVPRAAHSIFSKSDQSPDQSGEVEHGRRRDSDEWGLKPEHSCQDYIGQQEKQSQD